MAAVITRGGVSRYCCGRTEEIDDVGGGGGGYCSVSQSGERDMIVVRDGIEPPFPVIARYCGHLDDVTVTSSDDAVLVEFDSNGRHQGPGFSGQYSFIAPRRPEPQTAANDERRDRVPSDRQPTKRPSNAQNALARLVVDLPYNLRQVYK